MKRKVIQIAESTQLISLPRKWCLENNIKKGAELNVEPQGQKITVSCGPETVIERAEIKLKDYGVLAPRMIYALYKKGADEVKIHFDAPEDIQIVQNALRNETVGYEVVEQDSKSCLIKNVSGHIEGFDNMLRRTFLLLVTMAEECNTSLKNKDPASLKNLLILEESNNRFTTLCRRYLNKYGAPEGQKPGPLYRILEELENIADEYKYLFKALSVTKKEDFKVDKKILDMFETVHKMIREFYESFYKMDAQKIASVGTMRKQLVQEWHSHIPKVKNYTDFILMHHGMVIAQKVFNIIGAYFVLSVPTTLQSS